MKDNQDKTMRDKGPRYIIVSYVAHGVFKVISYLGQSELIEAKSCEEAASKTKLSPRITELHLKGIQMCKEFLTDVSIFEKTPEGEYVLVFPQENTDDE